MVFTYMNGRFLWFSCRYIYHTWMVWAILVCTRKFFHSCCLLSIRRLTSPVGWTLSFCGCPMICNMSHDFVAKYPTKKKNSMLPQTSPAIIVPTDLVGGLYPIRKIFVKLDHSPKYSGWFIGNPDHGLL